MRLAALNPSESKTTSVRTVSQPRVVNESPEACLELAKERIARGPVEFDVEVPEDYLPRTREPF